MCADWAKAISEFSIMRPHVSDQGMYGTQYQTGLWNAISLTAPHVHSPWYFPIRAIDGTLAGNVDLMLSVGSRSVPKLFV